MSKELAPQNNQAVETIDTIQTAMDIVAYSLSDTSKRQYQHSYCEWASFCQQFNIDISDMRAKNLIQFLEHGDLSHRTKQARLTHMRRLLQALHAEMPDNPAIRSMYEQARLLKVKRAESEKQKSKRPEYRLTKEQVYKALNVYHEDSKLHARNRALLAILLYCGLRRAEAAALQWDDLDLENKLLTVRHGKGDKHRIIPILGGTEYLEKWQAISGQRRYVFCGFRKGDKLATDKPMKTNALWVVIKEVERVLGLDGLSPHDFRRTFLTALINSGTPINIAQAIAGHENPETTLNYAEISKAEEMRARAKLPY